MSRLLPLGVLVALAPLWAGCGPADGPSLERHSDAPLRVGEHVPGVGERDASGPIHRPVSRGTPEFAKLVRCGDPRIVFKDEEGTGADRMMTPALRAGIVDLARRVRLEWPDLSLRVTDAWDEDREHGGRSLHYEGRAADITTSDLDSRKLGELARLATACNFDWVFYENASHVHVSVRR